MGRTFDFQYPISAKAEKKNQKNLTGPDLENRNNMNKFGEMGVHEQAIIIIITLVTKTEKLELGQEMKEEKFSEGLSRSSVAL